MYISSLPFVFVWMNQIFPFFSCFLSFVRPFLICVRLRWDVSHNITFIPQELFCHYSMTQQLWKLTKVNLKGCNKTNFSHLGGCTCNRLKTSIRWSPTYFCYTLVNKKLVILGKDRSVFLMIIFFLNKCIV